MGQRQNIDRANTLLAGLADGLAPEEIAGQFDPELVFEIQGDDGVLPWIGRKSGRSAMVNFVRDMRAMTEPLAFEVEDVLASETRVAIVGALRTRIKSTGKVTATQFAIILTIAGEKIVRFQMLEDSFDVSQASRP